MMSQIYIALSFALLNVLAYHSSATESVSQYNPILPLSIFIFNWVNDTGAYCTGMLFGKHRLFERISPKKSWEGSIGGAVFSIIAAIVLAHFFTFLSPRSGPLPVARRTPFTEIQCRLRRRPHGNPFTSRLPADLRRRRLSQCNTPVLLQIKVSGSCFINYSPAL